MQARRSLSTGTAISCRAGRRRLRHESQQWSTTSDGTLLFRAVHKSCETIESSSAYPLFGHLSVEVRHPNVLPGSVSAAAARLAGSHMNPEPPASHPPCLSPGSNLAGIIEVPDYVVAAQRIFGRSFTLPALMSAMSWRIVALSASEMRLSNLP